MRFRTRFLAAAVAGLGSGAPSTIVGVARGDDLLASTRAAGTMLLGEDAEPGPLLAAGAVVHACLSLVWSTLLVRALPRRHPIACGALAGLAIAGLDLGLVGRRLHAVAALPIGPQLADHVAFGVLVGAVVSRSDR
ncbi:MAG TPA: hypothetical protein VIB48_07840 [Acidimicrobiia bacterium]